MAPSKLKLRTTLVNISELMGKLAAEKSLQVWEMDSLEKSIEYLNKLGETAMYTAYRATFSLIYEGK